MSENDEIFKVAYPIPVSATVNMTTGEVDRVDEIGDEHQRRFAVPAARRGSQPDRFCQRKISHSDCRQYALAFE